MSIERRRTKIIFAVIQELIEQGRTAFQAGEVMSALRERGQPLELWEVRGEFSILQADGLIVLDEDSADWSLSEAASKQATG